MKTKCDNAICAIQKVLHQQKELIYLLSRQGIFSGEDLMTIRRTLLAIATELKKVVDSGESPPETTDG